MQAVCEKKELFCPYRANNSYLASKHTRHSRNQQHKRKRHGKKKVKNQLMYLFYLCEAQGQEKNIRTGEY